MVERPPDVVGHGVATVVSVMLTAQKYYARRLSTTVAGYCGADIKGLVTDATQNALRRHYPQIYATSDKLQIDISSIKLSVRDFARAMSALVPAAQRAATNPSIPLDASLRPLLGRVVERARLLLVQRFPFAASQKPVSGKGLLLYFPNLRGLRVMLGVQLSGDC